VGGAFENTPGWTAQDAVNEEEQTVADQTAQANAPAQSGVSTGVAPTSASTAASNVATAESALGATATPEQEALASVSNSPVTINGTQYANFAAAVAAGAISQQAATNQENAYAASFAPAAATGEATTAAPTALATAEANTAAPASTASDYAAYESAATTTTYPGSAQPLPSAGYNAAPTSLPLGYNAEAAAASEWTSANPSVPQMVNPYESSELAALFGGSTSSGNTATPAATGSPITINITGVTTANAESVAQRMVTALKNAGIGKLT
jgi:hypothetical protein